MAEYGDATAAPVVDLDVGPHLQEEDGVEDGHPGGALHPDELRLDVDHHNGDDEHEEQVQPLKKINIIFIFLSEF